MSVEMLEIVAVTVVTVVGIAVLPWTAPQLEESKQAWTFAYAQARRIARQSRR